MKIYIARHGQVLPAEYYETVDFPAGDPPLTELGCRQAELLGKHLASCGFCGKIYASPFRRTMETASVVAEIVGNRIFPLSCIREIASTQAVADHFQAMSAQELQVRFPLSDLSALQEPWWQRKAETYADVLRRVERGMDALMPMLQAEGKDVLFVGHGASCCALCSYFGIESGQHLPLYNCGLSGKDLESGEEIDRDASFLPLECRTNNAQTATA